MQCPNDTTPLQKARYEGVVEIDQGGSRGGVWLDHAELEAIQDSRLNDSSDELSSIRNYFDKSYAMALARNEGALSCPNCDREMEKREYGYCSQIMIDVCPSCRGVGLDEDEVSELEVFSEKSRAETAGVRNGFFSSLKSLFAQDTQDL